MRTDGLSIPVAPLVPLSIAILLNSWRSKFIIAIRDSYIRTIGAVSPESSLTFFYPVEKDDFPDPDEFDLIIIGGSNVDPRQHYPWILRMHSFILNVVKNYPRKKICGICWGHQTIARVFGGQIADMAIPELGVTEIELTIAGAKFFPSVTHKRLRVQQHHRREVSIAPKGFTELAQQRQCLVNDSNTILTFQGHPEKDAQTARLRIADSQRWFGTDLQDHKAINELLAVLELEDDGKEIWKRILLWANE